MRTFELFHLSLIKKVQMDLFGPDIPRVQWLREQLGEGFSFNHFGQVLHWVPQDVGEGDIVGVIQRQKEHQTHLSPAEGGLEVRRLEWQGAIVVVDPTHHDLGQRVAVERDQAVGRPAALLRSLLAEINAQAGAPYHIESKPIFDANSFWSFAKQHNGVLRNITFDFVVPNMWGAEANLDKELKQTGEDTGAEKVRVTFKGSNGVKTDSERVHNGVSYCERGAGSVRASALDGTPYHSKDTTQTSKIPDMDVDQEQQVPLLKRLAGKILLRE